VGYALGEAGLIAAFDRVRNHFGVNRVGQAGALAALADQGWLRRVVSGGVAAAVAALGGSLADRLFPKPIVDVAGLGAFVGGRAAFVAQTSLYGYLKERMGTSYPRYFEDPAFAGLIRAAAERSCAACAADLAVYAAALTGADGRLAADACAALARRCFADALAAAGAGAQAEDATAFADRAARTLWANVPHGMEVFAASGAAILDSAPVVDEFKALDRRIVLSSIRFRWIGVREQLMRRLDAPAVCADWRGRAGG
jgi:hypothetical protein